MKKIILLSALLSLCLLVTVNAQYVDLLDFNKTNGEGPAGSLILSGGLLYGMTQYGGAHNDGCIFSIKPDGSGYKDLMDFNGTNGSQPQRSLTLSGGILYGMTYNGGPSYYGNIFSFNPKDSVYKVLLNFNGSNGEYPGGNLTISGNVIYGVTSGGGVNREGTIFSIDTNGTGYKDLYDFYYVNGYPSTGWSPLGSLTLSDTVLYGMAYYGGANNDGCIFSINTDGSGYKDLFDFNGKNGLNPFGDLTLSDTVLYGMSPLGGANNDGCIFSINTDGSGYKDLLDFNGTNGASPFDDLILSGNVLYGMTKAGGANGFGCIFSINTDGSGYQDLLDFNNSNCPQGRAPYGHLTISGNIFYGATYEGGANNDGVVFSFNPTTAPTSANADVNNLCSNNTGGKITLTAVGGSGDTLKWYSGSCGGTLIGTGTPLSINKPTVTTTYFARWQTCGNYSKCASTTVTVNQLPSVTARGGTICNGSSRTLFAGDGIDFIWSTGENTRQIIVSPVETTTYTLTITGTGGCTASDFVVMDVIGNKAGFSFLLDKITNDVTFTDTSKGNISMWYWDFKDNNYSNLQNLKKQYSKPGIYKACLTVLDKGSLCQSTSCEDITIGTPSCHALFYYTLDSVTNTVKFTDQSIGTSLIHYWEFGNGDNSNENNLQYKFIYPGYYTIRLTINDTVNHLMDEYSTVVLAGKTGVNCKTDYGFSIDLANKTGYFLDKSVGFSTPKYHWDFGDNSSSNLQIPEHVFNGGFYDVCLTMQDSVTGCRNFICKNIKVDTLKTTCQANFIYGINLSNNEVAFTDKSFGNIDTWLWEFGDNTNSSNHDTIHFYKNTGYFKIHQRVGNSVSGFQSDNIGLIGIGNGTHQLKGAFSYFSDSTSRKKGVFPVDFKGATYGDASQFNWDFGDGTADSSSMSPSHEYSKDSTYAVCLTVSNTITDQTDETCDTITVIITGVNKLDKVVTTLNIYPNPTYNKFIISLDNVNGIYNLEILNTLGQVVLSKFVSNNIEQVDLSGNSAGVYFLKIQTGNNTIVKKIIKQD